MKRKLETCEDSLPQKKQKISRREMMCTNFGIMDNLPLDLLKETTKNLSNKEVMSIASTSIHHLKLFKPLTEFRPFLHHVTHGNHDAVAAMLENDISLFYKKGQVTDCSGRVFANISGFEYALWALDKHMWTRILECLPKTEEGLNVLTLLKGQYDNLVQKGVTYTLNGQIITEQHFDFESTIIEELQTQVNSSNAPGVKDWGTIDKQWREGVGGAQRELPMHAAFEYCSVEPFYPVPKFISQPKSTTQFYNSTTYKDENWFSVDSKLGVDFAICKTAQAGVAGVVCCQWQAGAPAAALDLDAMSALCKVRTEDFIALKSYLEARLIINNGFVS